MEYIGNLAVFNTAKGGVDIPVCGGHIFGHCLTDADMSALLALADKDAKGHPVRKDYTRADGTKGKYIPLGLVRVALEQVSEMETVDRSGRQVFAPIFKMASKPARGVDTASKFFFG